MSSCIIYFSLQAAKFNQCEQTHNLIVTLFMCIVGVVCTAQCILSDIDQGSAIICMTSIIYDSASIQYYLYMSYIDFFPSIYDNPFWRYSPGYYDYYPRPSCDGRIAGKVLTCTSTIVCYQKYIPYKKVDVKKRPRSSFNPPRG